MKRAGKGSIWELRVNDESKGIGTWNELAEIMGMSVTYLRTRVSQTKYRKNPRITYEVRLVEDMRETYKLFENKELKAEGTIKELSEKTFNSYSHLINLASGNKDSKNIELVRVG